MSRVVKLSIASLLFFALVVALHMGMRLWFVSYGDPGKLGIISLILGMTVAIFVGWTRRSAKLAAVLSAFTALGSILAILFELHIGSIAEEFSRRSSVDMQVQIDLRMSFVIAVFFSVIALGGGWIIGLAASHLASRVSQKQAALDGTGGETADASESPS